MAPAVTSGLPDRIGVAFVDEPVAVVVLAVAQLDRERMHRRIVVVAVGPVGVPM